MAAQNFIGSAAGSSTASAVWDPGVEDFVSFPSTHWRLDKHSNGYDLNRYVSSAFTTNVGSGGRITKDDLRELWLHLASLVG